jgi:hypothetical protein
MARPSRRYGSSGGDRAGFATSSADRRALAAPAVSFADAKCGRAVANQKRGVGKTTARRTIVALLDQHGAPICQREIFNEDKRLLDMEPLQRLYRLRWPYGFQPSLAGVPAGR